MDVVFASRGRLSHARSIDYIIPRGGREQVELSDGRASGVGRLDRPFSRPIDGCTTHRHYRYRWRAQILWAFHVVVIFKFQVGAIATQGAYQKDPSDPYQWYCMYAVVQVSPPGLQQNKQWRRVPGARSK
jgi:hypothetical protein